ncbi:MAG TPA: hypothetical protein VF120_02370 [Ktedonobacterales bacterium]
MSRIFISSTQGEGGAYSNLLAARLGEHFGAYAVLRGGATPPAGTPYAQFVGGALSQCAVQLVVLSPDWLSSALPGSLRPIDDPDDSLRQEVEIGLRLGLPLVVLLSDGMTLPAAHSLPASLSDLALAAQLPLRSGPLLDSDVTRLLRGLERWVPPIRTPLTVARSRTEQRAEKRSSRASARAEAELADAYGLGGNRGKPALRWGLVFAGVLIALGVVSALVQAAALRANAGAKDQPAFAVVGWLFFAADLLVYFLAGWLAGRQARQTGAGTGAGVLAALLSAPFSVYFAAVAGAMSALQAPSSSTNPDFEFALFIFGGVVLALLQIGLGAAAGAFGGSLGRRSVVPLISRAALSAAPYLPPTAAYRR